MQDLNSMYLHTFTQQEVEVLHFELAGEPVKQSQSKQLTSGCAHGAVLQLDPGILLSLAWSFEVDINYNV